MNLEVFIKYQLTDKAFMCINKDHAMPLVPSINIEDKIQLRCFTGDCDFKILPGLAAYETIVKELSL